MIAPQEIKWRKYKLKNSSKIQVTRSPQSKAKPLPPLILSARPSISFQPLTYYQNHELELNTLPLLLQMAGWLHSLVVSPLKKLWDRLHSSHRRRNYYQFPLFTFSWFLTKSPFKTITCMHSLCFAGRGLYILYKDVKSCPCEDVQVLWSILVESHAADLRK